jgi:hypothetical protein
MLMFLLILGAIATFVLYVMGVEIPGLAYFGIQQNPSPFTP